MERKERVVPTVEISPSSISDDTTPVTLVRASQSMNGPAAHSFVQENQRDSQ